METIKFIDSKFSPEEAKELLLDIITKKINFHNQKNLRSHIHYSKPDLESVKRMADLQDAKTHLLHIIQEAKDTHCDLVIESPINITLLAKKEVKEVCVAEEAY